MKTQTYTFNKFIFGTIFILGLIYLIIILNTYGSELIKPHKNTSCNKQSLTPCLIPGTMNEYLQPGESKITTNPNIKIANNFNNSILYSLIIGLIINHLYFNRKYPTKKKLEKMIKKIN